LVALRLPPDLIARLDEWAVGAAISRSEAMRRLIELGLKVAKRAPKR
jgi:metal-responsive CopG/Arc/MetJ family transcriptional regulator